MSSAGWLEPVLGPRLENHVSQETRQHANEEAANRFLDQVDGSGFWESIDLRFCAVRKGRRWVNLITRGFLDHRTPRSVPRLAPVDRRDVRAWQVVHPVAHLPAVVRGIAGGVVKLRPRSVRYVDESGQPTVDLRYSFSELAASYQTAEYDAWSCHSLVGYGSSIFNAVRQGGHDPFELDGMIRGGRNAYDGLPDLVRRFCARPRGLQVQGTTTIVELIAPLAARFDRESVASTPERVTVAVRAASDVFVAKAEFGWTLGTSGEPLRHGSTKLVEHAWKQEGAALRSQLHVPIRKSDDTATLFLLIGDRCVDGVSVPLTGSNPRMRAHNVFDPSGHEFPEELRDEKWRDAKKFETAVGLLLFFLGFQVDPLSAQKGREAAVDHLAHDPASSMILAVECTVGPPDGGGKLGKLIARSDYLRTQLPDNEVVAVLATARQRAALSEVEVEKAARDDVVLLAHEDLHELWIAAQAGETGGQVIRRLRNQLVEARLRRAQRPVA